MSLRVFYDDVKFRLKGRNRIARMIEKVIGSIGKVPGDLCFIFTTDENLLKINLEFLGHDYYTDVITFDYSENNLINGEVYISIETVKENAKRYKASFRNEIERVMIHGTLHLIGYDDDTEEKRNRMRALEDEWLMKEGN